MTFKTNQRHIIEVVAPASTAAHLDLNDIREFIKTLDCEARLAPDIVNPGAHFACANTDDVRVNNLLSALQAKDSKFIWALRGGYGSTIVLPMLDNYDFSANPKVFIGFSDITALFLYFYKKYKWPYIHSRVLTQYVQNKVENDEIDLIKKMLASDLQDIEYIFSPLNEEAKVEGLIRGEIIGGNLSLIQCSLGTAWQIDANNKILFIEEVNEKGYAIHRSLTHLKQAGVFEDIKALIIGDIGCADDADKELCDVAIMDFIKDLDCPVIKSESFGHGVKNYPLCMGVDVSLSLGKNVVLSYT